MWKFVLDKLETPPQNVKRIGGGYYADVFKFDYESKKALVVKIYKTAGIMENEAIQLDILRHHCLFDMPTVLLSHKAENETEKDFIVMSFLEGENAGNIHYLNPKKRQELAKQVVDNLLTFHNVKSPDGFGEIGSGKRYETFNEYYKKRAVAILEMASQLKNKGELTDSVFDIMTKALEQFNIIFRFPITEASLVHGDYNMWNILVDKKACKVTGVIDPCGAMWADNEYDLYQLSNANGKHFRLFEEYAAKNKLSENCNEKMAFYELFTEIEHYYKSSYPVQKSLVKKQADKLNYYLERL